MSKNQKRERLRQARLRKNLTQSQLAAQVNVTLEHIKSLEYGRVNPSASLMFKICSVLDESPETLFSDVVTV